MGFILTYSVMELTELPIKVRSPVSEGRGDFRERDTPAGVVNMNIKADTLAGFIESRFQFHPLPWVLSSLLDYDLWTMCGEKEGRNCIPWNY